MSYYIGIDIGTGSTKALALDASCKSILNIQQVAYPTIYPEPHYVEQDPEVIWNAFVTCIKNCVKEMEEMPLGIGISSAMHSLIPVDQKGNALMNMITWADGRSADIAEELKKSEEGVALYKKTGTPIHAMTPLSKIIWLKKYLPSTVAQTNKFISIKEYIWYKLFGVFEVDYSIASGSGLFNIQTLEWESLALRRANISSKELSTPVNTSVTRSEIKPEIANSLGFDGIPFTIGGSDGCLANLGSQAITPGLASLTIGTSGAIRVASKTPCFNYRHMTFSYRLDDELYICGGPINNGGTTLKWYVKNLLKQDPGPETYSMLLKEAQDIGAGSRGLLFLPYLLGERAPIWNSKSCGVYFGITHEHSQAHFTRALLEGISLALYCVGKALEEASGKIDVILASGGFVQSPLWLQIVADVFNKNVMLQNSDDASAIGAALMAMKTIQQLDHYPIFLGTSQSIVIKPIPENHIIYDKSSIIFKRLYDKLKDEMEMVYESNKR